MSAPPFGLDPKLTRRMRKRRAPRTPGPAEFMPPGIESRSRRGVFVPWDAIEAIQQEKMREFDRKPEPVKDAIRNAKK